MRNLLATILFSFLMCGIANAKKIHDANENGILMTECVFSNGKCYRIAENHCAQYKKFYVHVPNHQTEKPFTVRMYCVTDFHQFFYEPIMKKQLKVYKTNYDPNSPWATGSKKSNSNSTSSLGTGDKIAQSKQICKDLGFKVNTEKFADCALKMMSMQFEATNKVASSGSTTQEIIVKHKNDYDIWDALLDTSALLRNNNTSNSTSSSGTNCKVYQREWGADMVCR